MSLGTKSTIKAVVGVAALCAIVVLGYELYHWLTHVYAGGARVQTELTRMSGRVDGTIAAIHVREGDRVEEGQLLISLFDDDIRLAIQALEIDLSLEQARRRQLVAEREAFEVELRSKLAVKRETMRAIEVEHRSIRDRLELAEKDLSRMTVLFSKELTAERELGIEQAKVLVLRGESALSMARLAIATRELEQVEATGKQLDVIDERVRLSAITEDKIRTNIEAEKVALEFRHIRSPMSGIIDRVFRYKGEYVEEGDPILALHDESLFWIEAHVDEDQIRYLEVGQRVEIDLESHPFRWFYGKVESIGSVTAQQVGLSEQRTSQFGRQAERVPVRISIDAPPTNLTPGMVANVNVRIYD